MRSHRHLERIPEPGKDTGWKPAPPGSLDGFFALLSLSTMAMAVAGGGCARPRAADLHSADPVARVRAIQAAAERGDRQAVPLIVDRLEDEDEAVRFYAIVALDRITGQRFGYDYAKPAAERARAVECWRAFVRSGGHARDRHPGVAAGEGQGSAMPTEGGRESPS